MKAFGHEPRALVGRVPKFLQDTRKLGRIGVSIATLSLELGGLGPPNGSLGTGYAVGDVNGDGKPDIVSLVQPDITSQVGGVVISYNTH